MCALWTQRGGARSLLGGNGADDAQQSTVDPLPGGSTAPATLPSLPVVISGNPANGTAPPPCLPPGSVAAMVFLLSNGGYIPNAEVPAFRQAASQFLSQECPSSIGGAPAPAPCRPPGFLSALATAGISPDTFKAAAKVPECAARASGGGGGVSPSPPESSSEAESGGSGGGKGNGNGGNGGNPNGGNGSGNGGSGPGSETWNKRWDQYRNFTGVCLPLGLMDQIRGAAAAGKGPAGGNGSGSGKGNDTSNGALIALIDRVTATFPPCVVLAPRPGAAPPAASAPSALQCVPPIVKDLLAAVGMESTPLPATCPYEAAPEYSPSPDDGPQYSPQYSPEYAPRKPCSPPNLFAFAYDISLIPVSLLTALRNVPECPAGLPPGGGPYAPVPVCPPPNATNATGAANATASDPAVSAASGPGSASSPANPGAATSTVSSLTIPAPLPGDGLCIPPKLFDVAALANAARQARPRSSAHTQSTVCALLLVSS